MRPIVSEQDFLRYPLNELFGTRAHVRLLQLEHAIYIAGIGARDHDLVYI